MTEAEWLVCVDPGQMLDALGVTVSGRKLRLFAGACCYRLVPCFKDESSLRMIDASDRFADGQASSKELNAAFDEAGEAQEAVHWESGGAVDQAAAEGVLGLREELELNQVLGGVEEATRSHEADKAWDQIALLPPHLRDAEIDRLEIQGMRKEKFAQALLLRDIFGNPFRPVAFAPEWRTDTALALAQQMYDSRDFGAMPILADALQDAGCDSDDVLNHCRDANQVHVRGVLGRGSCAE